MTIGHGIYILKKLKRMTEDGMYLKCILNFDEHLKLTFVQTCFFPPDFQVYVSNQYR